MSTIAIVPGVYQIPLGFVSVYLLDLGELTLIDTGIASSAPAILNGIRQVGKNPQDLSHILITHPHGDHVGSLKAIQQASGAKIYMHRLDAESYAAGQPSHNLEPGPGLLSKIIVRRMRGRRSIPAYAPVTIDECLEDGQVLDFAGGLKAIHTPGHTSGHLAFLLPTQGGILFAGDACSNMFGLGLSILYENYPEGLKSLQKLSGHSFNTACFAHGKPITDTASDQFHKKWGTPVG